MRIIVLAALLVASIHTHAALRCYAEKDVNKAVEMYGDITVTKPRIMGYMYTEEPFLGECDHKVNGYCQYVSHGFTGGFFKPNQVKVIPMSECTVR